MPQARADELKAIKINEDNKKRQEHTVKHHRARIQTDLSLSGNATVREAQEDVEGVQLSTPRCSSFVDEAHCMRIAERGDKF